MRVSVCVCVCVCVCSVMTHGGQFSILNEKDVIRSVRRGRVTWVYVVGGGDCGGSGVCLKQGIMGRGMEVYTNFHWCKLTKVCHEIQGRALSLQHERRERRGFTHIFTLHYVGGWYCALIIQVIVLCVIWRLNMLSSSDKITISRNIWGCVHFLVWYWSNSNWKSTPNISSLGISVLAWSWVEN